MDKKEQIKKAAIEYANSLNPKDMGITAKRLAILDFIKGAEWALTQPKEVDPKKEVDLDELREIIESCIGHSDLNILPEMGLDLNEETTELTNDIINSISQYLQKPVESDAVEFAEWIKLNSIELQDNKTDGNIYMYMGILYYMADLYTIFKQLKK